MEFDRAIENLQYAAQFGDPLENSYILDMVETQMADINSEKESKGVARKEENEE